MSADWLQPIVTRIAQVHVPDELGTSDGGIDILGFGQMPFGHNQLERGGFAYGKAEPGRPIIATIEFGGSTVPDDTPLDSERRFADLMHQAHQAHPVLLDVAGGGFAESAQEWRDRVEVVIAGAAR
ncbi:MAG TPA: hypothetical protein VEF72_12575 [Mycobacterium sp.]|nr:hypothetical protein [Mycobacterium sp.]